MELSDSDRISMEKNERVRVYTTRGILVQVGSASGV